MNLTKEKRQAVSKAQKIVETIGNKLQEKEKEVRSDIDLGKIAKSLGNRRDRVLSEE